MKSVLDKDNISSKFFDGFEPILRLENWYKFKSRACKIVKMTVSDPEVAK